MLCEGGPLAHFPGKQALLPTRCVWTRRAEGHPVRPSATTEAAASRQHPGLGGPPCTGGDTSLPPGSEHSGRVGEALGPGSLRRGNGARLSSLALLCRALPELPSQPFSRPRCAAGGGSPTPRRAEHQPGTQRSSSRPTQVPRPKGCPKP